ncbi:unnamed protein product [Moneuplotes crassus]|uniref:Dynein light chain roadblock n=1 Tax=Euplotes crassus TaxID=5936 RepID=A0AAD1Y850_EUPCR|nr:unnamed protein product [Moneuplotes crassus]
MNKIEETWNRINTHKGVEGIIIIDSMGSAIKTTMDQNKTIEYGSLVNQFCEKAILCIKSLHEEEEIVFIRIRSQNKNEIMIAPTEDYTLIVVQNPSEEAS